jgi:hypothetical protein
MKNKIPTINKQKTINFTVLLNWAKFIKLFSEYEIKFL